jgi:rhamnosyltransferase
MRGFEKNFVSNNQNEHNISVCCIIVTYQPDTTILKSVMAAIRPQVDQVLFIDNGSINEFIGWLSDKAGGAEVIEMGENFGVAAAQNRGICWAKRRGFSHILFLDQDSIPEADMVRYLIEASIYLDRHKGPLGAVGPRIVDARIGKDFPFINFGSLLVKRMICRQPHTGKYVLTDFLISSGMLVSLLVFEKIGLMEEGFYIDNVDLEWCFRARSQGFALYGVCDAKLDHNLGDQVIHFWLGRLVNIYRHSPIRQYYMMRNRILLYRKRYTPLSWAIQDFFRLSFKLMFVVLFFPQRRENIRMILKGIGVGLRGKMENITNRDNEHVVAN